MKSVRKNQVSVLIIMAIAIGCMAHISVRYSRAVKRMEEHTARVETMRNAYIHYLEHKVEALSTDSIAVSEH